MSERLTLEDAQQSLSAHIATKGAEIRAKFGPQIGWQELQRILEDRDSTRYPVEIVFDVGPLRDGEFAYPKAKTENPEDGFTMYVHPFFSTQPLCVPALVLYQLVLVNYGDFASPTDAEIFGAAVLGISTDDYYAELCEMADLVSEGIATAKPQAPEAAGGGCGCGGSCGCH
jgi:hypothetical protein